MIYDGLDHHRRRDHSLADYGHELDCFYIIIVSNQRKYFVFDIFYIIKYFSVRRILSLDFTLTGTLLILNANVPLSPK